LEFISCTQEHFISIPAAYDSTYNEPITIPLSSQVDIKLLLKVWTI
jgi:hypothetical protein